MPDHKKTTLANNLIIAGITHIGIGGGYLLLSAVTAKHLSHNSYLGLFLGLLLFLPLVLIVADFARLFPHQSFTDIYRRVLGKYCGAFLSLLFILHIIIISALGLKQSQLMVFSYFFTTTPPFLFNIIFIAVVLYPALHGIKAISRLAAFTLVLPLTIFFFLHLLGLSDIHWINVRPILTGTPVQWLNAAFNSLYLFIPAYASVFYLPFIKEPKQMLKVALVPLGIIFPLFFLATLGMVGTFGPTIIAKMAWPAIEFFHVIDLPFLLLEQTGLFFIITWFAFLFLGETLAIYNTSHELHFLWPRLKFKWLIIIVGLIFLIIASLPLNTVTIISLSDRFYWLFILLNYAPFLITWLVARVRFRKKIYNP